MTQAQNVAIESSQINSSGILGIAGGGTGSSTAATVAGTGISVSGTFPNQTVTNAGVTSIVAGTGISISGATGAVTITNSVTSPIPAGTVTNFIQSAAPTGWTQVTTWNNYAFRVVSGVGGGTGGTVAFTTAFASQTPAGSVSTSISAVSGSVAGGAVSAYTLATTDIPSHTHVYPATNTMSGSSVYPQGAGPNRTYTPSTDATGGGGSHTHAFTQPTFTFSSGTASSSFTGTAINLAVQYVDNIIASKN